MTRCIARFVVASVTDHPGALRREALRRDGFRARLLAVGASRAGAARRMLLNSCRRMGAAFVNSGGVATGGIESRHRRRGQQRPRRRFAAVPARLRLLELRHRPDGSERSACGAEVVIDWHC